MTSTRKFERGELVTILGRGDYEGKPRPAIILQHQRHALNSVIVCPLTSTPIDLEVPYRIQIEPNRRNGLKLTSWAMADKISSISRERISGKFGTVESTALERIADGLNVLLDF